MSATTCREVCGGGYKAYHTGSIHECKLVLPCKTCHPDWWADHGSGKLNAVRWWPARHGEIQVYDGQGGPCRLCANPMNEHDRNGECPAVKRARPSSTEGGCK